MAQIIALLQKLLNLVSTILSVVGVIQGQTAKVAQENSPFEIDTATQEILSIVTDGTFGNEALESLIAANQSTLTSQLNDIEAQLALVQLAGQPVTLPAVPPPGYASLTGDDAALAVWSAVLPYPDQQAGDKLNQCATFALNVGNIAGFPYWEDPKFIVVGPGWWNFLNAPPTVGNFFANTDNILPDDTRKTWLEREIGVDFGAPNPTTGWYQWVNSDEANWAYVLPWSEDYFELVKAHYKSAAATSAPIWPGILNVTLGTPVALDVGLTVTTPMDGVLVSITAVPPGTGLFQFDDVQSYRFIGAIAFVTDDGEEEFPQNLGFESAVYCPKAMQSAAAVKVRTKPGIVGTITPWTSL